MTSSVDSEIGTFLFVKDYLSPFLAVLFILLARFATCLPLLLLAISSSDRPSCLLQAWPARCRRRTKQNIPVNNQYGCQFTHDREHPAHNVSAIRSY